MLSHKVAPALVEHYVRTSDVCDMTAMLNGREWDYFYSRMTLPLAFDVGVECAAVRIAPFGYVVRLQSGEIRAVAAPSLGFLVRASARVGHIRGGFTSRDLEELGSDMAEIMIRIYRHAYWRMRDHFPSWWIEPKPKYQKPRKVK